MTDLGCLLDRVSVSAPAGWLFLPALHALREGRCSRRPVHHAIIPERPQPSPPGRPACTSRPCCAWTVEGDARWARMLADSTCRVGTSGSKAL